MKMSALRDTTVAFIGTGTMAEAMIQGILSKELITPDKITGSDPRSERGEELNARYGIQTTTDNTVAAATGNIIVFSVKPQVLPRVLVGLAGHVRPDALILSIVAGAKIATISNKLNHRNIVRVMPNTPAQIGQGMSVWTATPETSEVQREQAQAILEALGEEIFVADEDYLDMATALSGTGPAYVFLFMEALIDAGVHMGFSRRIAQKLVLKTVEGSVVFARESNLHPAQLRDMVTSPGGTSAEAIYQLEKGGLRTVLSRAVWAAYQKSKYLGGLSKE
jgi:pyrroline-5-carboxylate reductase